MTLLHEAAAFLAAALLFMIQPLVARMLLPLFGGGAAVWTTCMMFFQAALLAGYLYAHVGTVRLSARSQIAVHMALLAVAAVALPLAVRHDAATAAAGGPVAALVWTVAAGVGLPFFALSTSTPLLHRWLAHTPTPGGRDSWRLYAASNAGSMLGLVAYPSVVEPCLGLADQAWCWSAGYWTLGLLMAMCGWLAWHRDEHGATGAAVTAPPAASWRERIAWIALAAVPSSLMLGVTTVLTTDLPPVPLLWVVPLALYLGTFIVAFGLSPARLRWTAWVVPAALVADAVLTLVSSPSALPVAVYGCHLVAFTAVAAACHAELAAVRPPAASATEFYLWVAVGGALGGVFNAVVAPLAFTWVAEFPLGLAAGAVVVAAARLSLSPPGLPVPRSGRSGPVWLATAAGVAAISVLWAAWQTTASLRVIHQERGFFGVLRVVQGVEGRESTHELLHGMVGHGAQVLTPPGERPLAPLLYYHPLGPIGQVLTARMQSRDSSPVGVVGLGCGSLAYYWLKDQPFVFFEIDPAVIRVAADPRYFTFLRDSRARCTIVPGDGRLSLASEPDGRFGLLVIDAFSGDAIPIHLLTVEALRLYAQKLTAGGAIAFHISNAYFDLEPVLAASAAAAGLQGVMRHDDEAGFTEADLRTGRMPSDWALLAAEASGLRWVEGDPRWRRLPQSPGNRAWTDDHAHVLGALRGMSPVRPSTDTH